MSQAVKGPFSPHGICHAPFSVRHVVALWLGCGAWYADGCLAEGVDLDATLEEEKIDGYDSVITKTPETGFVITADSSKIGQEHLM